uniref:Uncharacterized protein n=1 Tax=Scophthalmus maximus TaxID=52904 RepID=A0A8D3DZX3_SCOMX
MAEKTTKRKKGEKEETHGKNTGRQQGKVKVKVSVKEEIKKRKYEKGKGRRCMTEGVRVEEGEVAAKWKNLSRNGCDLTYSGGFLIWADARLSACCEVAEHVDGVSYAALVWIDPVFTWETNTDCLGCPVGTSWIRRRPPSPPCPRRRHRSRPAPRLPACRPAASTSWTRAGWAAAG